MTQAYRQLGVPLSLYSGKTRSYLLHKGLPFSEDLRGGAKAFFWDIPRHTGAAALPAVITPEGAWLQDSSCIIDALEQRHPERPVLPATPVLRFAAYLFELWGDEFWVPLAMHARWSHAENMPLFVRESGDALMPGLPRWLKNLLGRNHVRKMQAICRNVGIRPEQLALLDRFAQLQLDALDAHFARHRFLFGGRPSLGDYGLIAPLYAHLGRDPWPARELIAPRPHLQAWIARMFEPASSQGGEFQAEDLPAASLAPALRSICAELLPFVQACAERLARETPVLPPQSRRAQRYLSEVCTPMAGGLFRRQGLSYPVWMAQRLQDAWRAMNAEDAACVREWLRDQGGEGWLSTELPRVRRVGLAAARLA